MRAKTTAWVVGAFVAGLVVSQASTHVRAEVEGLPRWVKPGVCLLGPNFGTEFVLEIEGQWVKTSRSPDGTEDWRNLSAVPWVRRLSEDLCSHSRG
jgi:hypothetical protein